MNNYIRLPRTVVRELPEGIGITHNATGLRIVVPKDRLDRWCVRQLRAAYWPHPPAVR